MGPTKDEARRRCWRRITRGWYVDDASAPDCCEQRILEQSIRIPATGAVTGWAALRWKGANFFDGTNQGGRRVRPVPLVIGGAGNLRPDPAVHLSWEQFPPAEFERVAGLPCAISTRALFDEVRWARGLRAAVVAADMAYASGVVGSPDFAGYVDSRPAWTAVGQARAAVLLADPGSMSPPETLLRLVWVLDAQLPMPLCNVDVFSDAGLFLGRPDLFDPAAGLVGEYDGAHHLRQDQRQRDREREERFRDHGMEYVSVVRGEMANTARVVARLHAAYRRARQIPPACRQWVLDR